ncbi:translation initiation factor eIF 4e-like domain-containing protein [Sporodiniella umbellata]|nr:translation initiation factor eIF 4e-like domain-containing protein [Sporodiniella umbellata]
MASALPEVAKASKNIDYAVKHSLLSTWTLWFDNPGKKTSAQSWADNLKEVITIDNVEDFWSTFNNVCKINHLSSNSNFHLFKEGIRPEWEDPANAEGGKYGIQFPKSKAGDSINEHWMNLLLAVIGEQLVASEDICGAVVSVRKTYYRLALWTKSSKDEEQIEKIKAQLREVFSLPEEIEVEFVPHVDSTAKIAAELASASLEENAAATDAAATETDAAQEEKPEAKEA